MLRIGENGGRPREMYYVYAKTNIFFFHSAKRHRDIIVNKRVPAERLESFEIINNKKKAMSILRALVVSYVVNPSTTAQRVPGVSFTAQWNNGTTDCAQ